jgi:hypothetical protein
MPARCKTCAHPRRADIDIELARGTSGLEVARRFDLPPSTVWRHKRYGHVPPSVVAAFPQHRAELSAEALAKLRAEESQGVLMNLALQRSRLLRLQERADAEGDGSMALAAARELHRNIELVARAIGEFAQHERSISQVAHLHVMMQPEYVQLRSGLIRALRPHPEARRAVGEVLAALEAAPVHFDGIQPVPPWLGNKRLPDGRMADG